MTSEFAEWLKWSAEFDRTRNYPSTNDNKILDLSTCSGAPHGMRGMNTSLFFADLLPGVAVQTASDNQCYQFVPYWSQIVNLLTVPWCTPTQPLIMPSWFCHVTRHGMRGQEFTSLINNRKSSALKRFIFKTIFFFLCSMKCFGFSSDSVYLISNIKSHRSGGGSELHAV